MSEIKGPFEVYEDYDNNLHIIDNTTRVVLSDAYAYDTAGERDTRMANIARALSCCYGILPADLPTIDSLRSDLSRLSRELEAMTVERDEERALHAKLSADYHNATRKTCDSLAGQLATERYEHRATLEQRDSALSSVAELNRELGQLIADLLDEVEALTHQVRDANERY